MVGAIIGDVVGSRFEFDNVKTKVFTLFDYDCTFTDDTVMTCAVAEALMRSWDKDRYLTLEDVARETLRDVGYWHPCCGYGARFIEWMYKAPIPYNSCGNGSAMRISPVGDVARSIEEVKYLSNAVTAISHNHPEGLKGAEAVAVAIYMLRNGKTKKEVKKYVEENYYDLSGTVKDFRKETDGHGKELCQISVPQAFACFFEGVSFRDVIRNCVSIGGDTDTIGAIAGGMAEAFYGVPKKDVERVMGYLSDDLLDISIRFKRFKADMNAGRCK